MTIQSDMEQILSLAKEYIRSASPAMAQRSEALGRLKISLRNLLSGLTAGLDLSALDLQVEDGGYQGNYSPTPWLRIYSREFSRSATQGFYIVYLFANDGSAVYLSLNQGTSEWRSGAWRPINNREELKARAAAARSLLGDFRDTALIRNLAINIDLASAEDRRVGEESRRRTQNYADANIFARRYGRYQIPSDETLEQDLSDLLPLLAVLYEYPFPYGEPKMALPPKAKRTAQRTRARGAGRVGEYEKRRAIELYAEKAATACLEIKGWAVHRVAHLNLGYDLECTGSEGVLHVEVKGTQSKGEEVLLTRGEVLHLPGHGGECDAGHALFVLSNIDASDEPPFRCEGGTPRLLMPWNPDAGSLTATEYEYRLPLQESFYHVCED
jgi:MrcB-like, N-terminal domain/Domain of unknown function (DUF3883)